jgi:hypothetical protein
MDNDAREDIPAAKHCNISLTSLFALPPYVYKRERRATVTRADKTEHLY